MNTENYDKEPRYVISVAARMLETNTYTLRYYERVGVHRAAALAGQCTPLFGLRYRPAEEG